MTTAAKPDVERVRSRYAEPPHHGPRAIAPPVVRAVDKPPIEERVAPLARVVSQGTTIRVEVASKEGRTFARLVVAELGVAFLGTGALTDLIRALAEARAALHVAGAGRVQGPPGGLPDGRADGGRDGR